LTLLEVTGPIQDILPGGVRLMGPGALGGGPEVISMSTFLAIQALHEEGMAKKAIARKLGVDPRTVRKHIRRIEAGVKEPRRARVSRKLDRLEPLIRAKVEQGLSAVQIYQDLSGRRDFDASYETVKLRVRELRPAVREVFCRMTFRPGEEGQIDFGEVGRLLVGAVLRKVYLFVLTLCWSRYSYYELVTDQMVPTFLGAIRRGFEHIGGVPERLKPDNLRSAVLLNQLGERYYQEDFFRFCRHYGTLPDAARPATPTDKGRTEREIEYVKGSCFRGRQITTLDEGVEHLARWADEVARVRVHGTTRRRPIDLFAEEQRHLRALPEDPYEVARWGRYKVRKDCHVHVEGNYYSVPYRLVGGQVTARLTEREVTVFSDGEEVARHERAVGKGRDVTDPSHYPPTKRLATQEIHRKRVMAVRSAGPRTSEFLGRLKEGRWVFGDQVTRMARLVATYGEERVERACHRALAYGAWGAATVQRILERDLDELPLPCEIAPPALQGTSRDFGRPLGEYQTLLAQAEVR
jgi:transposase